VEETPQVDRTQLKAYDRAACYNGNYECTSRVTETMAAGCPDALANASLPSVQRPKCTAKSLWGLARNIPSVHTGSQPRRTKSTVRAQENIMVQVQRQLPSQGSGQEERSGARQEGPPAEPLSPPISFMAKKESRHKKRHL
jgi:hypothetical protein